jgi:hypothetical protein
VRLTTSAIFRRLEFWFSRFVPLFMCLALLPVCGAAADTQSAGAVKAMIPDASRNAHPLAVNDPLQWNDLLQTDAKGRVRAGLNDGSILSLGSNSQLRIVQHDAAVQQTQIDLTYGKLRNQVTKITQPQGKYQVKTSNAVIGVIGTDFYVDYAKGRTTVICYEGRVSVTPVGDARVMGSTNVPAAPDGSMTLRAGQIVIIGPKISRDETLLYPVLMQQSKNDTDVSASATTAAKPQLDDGQTRTAKGLPTLAGKDDTDVSAPATTAAKPQLDDGQTRTAKGLPTLAGKDDTDVSAPATTAAKPQLDDGQTRTAKGLPTLAGKDAGRQRRHGRFGSRNNCCQTTARWRPDSHRKRPSDAGRQRRHGCFGTRNNCRQTTARWRPDSHRKRPSGASRQRRHGCFGTRNNCCQTTTRWRPDSHPTRPSGAGR